MRKRIRREKEMAVLVPPEWTVSSCGTRKKRYENARCSTTGWLIASQSVESIQFPTLWNPSHFISLANSSSCIPSFRFAHVSLFVLRFLFLYSYPFLLLFVTHKTDRLPSATDFHTDIIHAMQYRARGNKMRYWSIDKYKVLTMCTPRYFKCAQDITIGWRSFKHWMWYKLARCYQQIYAI